MHSCKGRLGARCIAAVVGVLGLAAAASAAPLQLRLANGLSAEIHRPEDLLVSHVTRSGATTQFVVHDRLRYELVTEVDDPIIANRGDGRFHPMSVEAVAAALEAVRLEEVNLHVTVFVLPYPRRNILDSSAREGMIFLSPGTRPVSDYAVHFTVTHEIGHVFQYRWMPDRDTQAWSDYGRLRGIDDSAVYHAGAAHRDRPHEVFAEDFRYLFGGERANYSGSIENDALPLPDRVAGLSEFLRELTVGPVAPVAVVRAAPNPFNPTAEVRVDLAAPAREPMQLRVLDAQGREIRRLFDGTPASQQLRVVWDGRTSAGAAAPSGVYFARLDMQKSSPAAAKLVLVR